MKSVFWKPSGFTGDGDSKKTSLNESTAIFSERSATASSPQTILLRAALVLAVFLALFAASAAAQCAVLSGPLVNCSPASRFVTRYTSLSGVAREKRESLGSGLQVCGVAGSVPGGGDPW